MIRPKKSLTGVCAAVCLACALPAAASEPPARVLLAQLLLAGDLASACPHFVQRKGGRDRHRFIQEGVIQIINENDVTMQDLIAVQNSTSPSRMQLLKRDELTRLGLDIDNRDELCFFARQVAGGTDRLGRYLEKR